MIAPVVLLVEDNADDEVLTLRAFRKNKITSEVVVARDGQEALDYLFGSEERVGGVPLVSPRVILLDLQLPKVSGLEVLRQLRANERTRYVPTVILTSSAEERDVLDGYRLGANSYLRKPVNFSEFVEAAKCLGQYWLTMNVPAPEKAGP